MRKDQVRAGSGEDMDSEDLYRGLQGQLLFKLWDASELGGAEIGEGKVFRGYSKKGATHSRGKA